MEVVSDRERRAAEHAEAESALSDAVGGATVVDPTGSGTHREVGGPPPTGGLAVRAPSGVLSYDPADLTVTVAAGTTVGELDATLAPHGQECALDPFDDVATIGGTIAVGLSGLRRLRVGPIRDQVLEVRFVTADGRIVRGGGPTVKNVTGYDLPRLLVGSFGTLGVLTRLVLRCRPRPPHAQWFRSGDAPSVALERCLRPSSVLWDGAATRVLLEGHVDDLEAEGARAGLEPDGPPEVPAGPHRGRISVRPGVVMTVGRRLAALDRVAWLADAGVGTIHVAAADPLALGECRAVAHDAGGWMLREAGAPGLDGFGQPLPNLDLAGRVHRAFDPTGKLAPGRLPLPQVEVEVDGPGR
ncbi:MAG: FAD-binding protein [Acidimicrobiia bacterium]